MSIVSHNGNLNDGSGRAYLDDVTSNVNCPGEDANSERKENMERFSIAKL